jgi:hypothetical protein
MPLQSAGRGATINKNQFMENFFCRTPTNAAYHAGKGGQFLVGKILLPVSDGRRCAIDFPSMKNR